MNSELRLCFKKVLTPPPVLLIQVADSGAFSVLGMCSARVSVADRSTTVLFAVLEKCSHELILGMDFLAGHSALIDCGIGLLQLDLPYCYDTPTTPQPHTPLLATASPSQSFTDADFTKMIAPDLFPAQAADLRHILASFRKIFDFGDSPLGQTSVVTHRINTGDASPI
nr:uncharacterized protein LOC119175579 [Rhipicephalus microplus]